MAVNKNAYQRYRIIDRAIRSNNTIASRQNLLDALADELITITKDQLSKDIAYLKDHKQAPIIFDRKIGGYRYTEPDYSFEHNSITEDDKWVLDFATATMNAYGNSNVMIQFEGLVNKLSTGSSKTKSKQTDGSHYIAVEQSTQQHGYAFLYDFYRAIIERKVFSINYTPFNKATRKYTLSPYLLKQYRNRWYVIGYAHEKESTLVFALDRIDAITPIKKAYYTDTKFSAADYFKYSFGVTHRYDLAPQKIKLWFNTQNKDYILSQPLHNSQIIIENNEQGLVVEIEVLITWELKAMIFSYSNGIKVLEPVQLQKEIEAELKAAIELYK